MIKVGDKVFVCGDSSYVGAEFNGKIGEITSVDKFDPEAEYEVLAIGTDGHPTRFWHPASSVLFVDADGWIENTGVQPVADGVLLDTKWGNMAPEFAHEGDTFVWTIGFGITHWRFHQEGKTEPAPLQPPRALSLSEQVAAMEDNAAVLKLVIQGLENEVAALKSKLEAIRGLV